jgi:predicted ATPase
MIRRVRLRRFKQFAETTFDLPGHVVLAGPNNTGKTTLLQAIAAWSFALTQWKELNNFHRRGGAYQAKPVARQAFSAVPLRRFDLLWRDRDESAPIVVEVETNTGRLAMEILADSTEQVYVRPAREHEPDDVRAMTVQTVFVPAMSGLSTEEPVYRPPKVNQLLGQAKPGEVLRNLLVEVHATGEAWQALCEAIARLFGVRLIPPDDSGPNIVAEYERASGTRLDLASAGSGFQQVLMLLSFLYARPASVLLIDEPDAHLHVILQDAIYGELKAVAWRQRSQLIMATHSEVIINAVDLGELVAVVGEPRIVETSLERKALIQSLGALTNEDILLARQTPGVLYLEDYTDLQILRAWARVLGHAACDLLTTKLFWRKTVSQPRQGAEGISARQHFEALRLITPDARGLELLDGDARVEIQPTPITGQGLQRTRWRRYEIESYLLHPASIERFVASVVGEAAAAPHVAAVRQYYEENFPPAFLRDPQGDHPFLNGIKARTELLPPLLTAGGLPGFDYTRYFQIAEQMRPDEIHPEVIEKLDAIVMALTGPPAR